jgi:ubiquinone/menaquinone biosynthesis C-methylase UbiE
MGQEINLLDRYPKSKRPIKERANTITEAHRAVARRFDREYFDGDRLTGYGGYNYHPRFWTDTVARIRDHYDLAPNASVLDVGCAKGFMMYDFKKLMPQLDIHGIDVSPYALENAPPEVRPFMQVANAKSLPFPAKSFDLVIAINTIHNLAPEECRQALREIARVSRKDAFVMNDAWRNDAEKQSMLDWNLTALTYMHVDDWKKLFAEVGYRCDYYWFIAESA